MRCGIPVWHFGFEAGKQKMSIKGQGMERGTTGLAAVGLTLPVWEQSLQHLGTVAAAALPILSAVWLAVQIVGFVWPGLKRRDDDQRKG